MSKAKTALILLLTLFYFSTALATAVNDTLPWSAQSPRFTLPTVGLESTVKRIADIIFYATVLIAFIMVVWGGVTMATAAGDPSKVDLARHMILYGLIAIAVGAISWGLVNLVASYIARLA